MTADAREAEAPLRDAELSEADAPPRTRSLHASTLVVASLSCLYFAVEVVRAVRVPFVMDEFQGASTVLDLARHVPYRDLQPYKTVLGYYAQLPVLLLVDDPWTRLVAARVAMAACVAVVVAWAALRLRRQFDVRAVLLSLAVLLATSDFLERSAELRVDMLTSLVGLVALVLLLEERYALAGALASLSFFVSQKGALFVVALGVAVATAAVLLAADRRRPFVRSMVGGAAVALAYLGAWSLIASPRAVLEATFVAPAGVVGRQGYELAGFWLSALARNPFLHAAAALGLGRLFAFRGTSSRARRDALLLGWGAAVVVLGLASRQPWPYFFVLLHPTLWILVASFLDGEISQRGSLGRPLVGAALVLGVAWPLARLPGQLARSSAAQRRVVSELEAWVPPGGSYLAGLRMLPERRHVGAGTLDWLDAVKLRALGRRDAEAVVALLEADPPDAVVWNYRLAQLPAAAREWIAAHAAPVSGALLLRAIPLAAGAGAIEVPHAGRYRLVAPPDARVVVDGRAASAGEALVLDAGRHAVDVGGEARGARLVWSPDGAPEPRGPQPRPADLFDGVYD